MTTIATSRHAAAALCCIALHALLLAGLLAPRPVPPREQGVPVTQVMLLAAPSSTMTEAAAPIVHLSMPMAPPVPAMPAIALARADIAPAAPAAPATTSPGTAAAPAVISAKVQIDVPAAPAQLQSARPDFAHNPPPTYPMALRELGIAGTVLLRVWVESDGRPGAIEVAKSSGQRLFDDAALRAVRQWRFSPARLGEQNLASWVEFPVRFALT